MKHGFRIWKNGKAAGAATCSSNDFGALYQDDEMYLRPYKSVRQARTKIGGHITVLDRKGLERRVCECYAVVKKEYDRLLPDRLAT